MNIADGYAQIVHAALRGGRPDPLLEVDRWSEQHMVLPKSSSEPGPYRIERTPYARRVLQVLSPGHPCKRVVVRAASQMLKTQVAINWMLASIHLAPANFLALEPTDKLAKRLSARISASIKDIPAVAAAVAQPRSRDSRNTIDAKDFKGGALYITTAGAASNLAEIPARYVYLDEVDRMEGSVDGEGDPVELAEARTTTFSSNCKIYASSSPTVKHFSKIDTMYEQGTQETYHVPCPHCDHLHELTLENFHFERDADTGFMAKAWFVCPDCGGVIEERHKGYMLPDEYMGGKARWVAASTGDGETISVTISAFYAKPGDISWLSLARQYQRALDRLQLGDPNAMRVFYNTRLGLSFEDTTHATSAKELMDRAREETYRLRVLPEQALVLTMGVDTHPDRLETQIHAWGPSMEHWVMDYQVLVGNPTDPPSRAGSVWQRLDTLRRTPLMHASGVPVYISAYLIDSGGHNTQDVYNYGADRERMGCVIAKGASQHGKPILSTAPSKVDLDWNGRKVENGARLWSVGTDTAKEWLYNRMKVAKGPGAMHMHATLGQQWFEALVAERPHRKMSKRGRVVVEWIRPAGAANEPWDLAVYNLAVAYKLGLHKWSEQDWARLRSKLIPAVRTLDLFGAVDAALDCGPAEATEPTARADVPAAQQLLAAVGQQMGPAVGGAVEPDVQQAPRVVLDVARIEEMLAPQPEPPVADVMRKHVEVSVTVQPTKVVDEPVAMGQHADLPLYPMNNHSLRRRRMRSKGI